MCRSTFCHHEGQTSPTAVLIPCWHNLVYWSLFLSVFVQKNIFFFFLVKDFLFVHLKGRVTETVYPLVPSLNDCRGWGWSWTRLKLGSRNSIWVSHMGCRGLSTWAISFVRCISRELDQQHSSQGWHSDTGCWPSSLPPCATMLTLRTSFILFKIFVCLFVRQSYREVEA